MAPYHLSLFWGSNQVVSFTLDEEELGRLWLINIFFSRREWNTFFQILRTAKEKHSNRGLFSGPRRGPLSHSWSMDPKEWLRTKNCSPSPRTHWVALWTEWGPGGGKAHSFEGHPPLGLGNGVGTTGTNGWGTICVQQRPHVARNSHYWGLENIRNYSHLKMQVGRNFLLDCKCFQRFIDNLERRGDRKTVIMSFLPN